MGRRLGDVRWDVLRGISGASWKRCWNLVGAVLGPHGASWGRLEASCGPLAASGGILGRNCPFRPPSWVILGPSCGSIG
eukprot:3560383-Pyramimonas_sp.AAC.1